MNVSNVSMYTNTHQDEPLLKVSVQHVRQLINGERPKLSTWDQFRNFFTDLMCCCCGGHRHATESELEEIYDSLYPLEGKGTATDPNVQGLMTTLNKLVEMTDEPHRERYQVYLEKQGEDQCMLRFCHGSQPIVERPISKVEKHFLEDHCFDVTHKVKGEYKLKSTLEPEDTRRRRMQDYGFLEECLKEGQRHSSKLKVEKPNPKAPKAPLAAPPSLQQQQRVLVLFPRLMAFCERFTKDRGFPPQPGEAEFQQQCAKVMDIKYGLDDYAAYCTRQNLKAVHRHLNNILGNHARMEEQEMKDCCSEINALLEHSLKHQLYSKGMSSDFIQSTRGFTWCMRNYVEINQRHDCQPSVGCYKEILQLLDNTPLKSISDGAQHQCLSQLRECCVLGISKLREVAGQKPANTESQSASTTVYAEIGHPPRLGDEQTHLGGGVQVPQKPLRKRLLSTHEPNPLGAVSKVPVGILKQGSQKPLGTGAGGKVGFDLMADRDRDWNRERDKSSLDKALEELASGIKRMKHRRESVTPYSFPDKFPWACYTIQYELKHQPSTDTRDVANQYDKFKQKINKTAEGYLKEMKDFNKKLKGITSKKGQPTPDMRSKYQAMSKGVDTWPEGERTDEAKKQLAGIAKLLMGCSMEDAASNKKAA